MDNTYYKAAKEVAVGDVVVERDGFMWTVTAATWQNKRVTLTLSPAMQSMTARGPVEVKLGQNRSVTCAMVTA